MTQTTEETELVPLLDSHEINALLYCPQNAWFPVFDQKTMVRLSRLGVVAIKDSKFVLTDAGRKFISVSP